MAQKAEDIPAQTSSAPGIGVPGVANVRHYDPNARKQRLLGPMENCAIRGLVNGLIGGVMGAAIGVFMGSYESSVGDDIQMMSQLSTRDQLRQSWKSMKFKSKSYAKNFAFIGGMYTTIECIVDKHRGKKDIYTGLTAGCVSGALLGARGGPSAALTGCLGFAAFSGAIDYFMEKR